MRNELFKSIGYWSGVFGAVLGLINFIICFINGVKVLDTELDDDVMALIWYPAEHGFDTVLYKVSIGIAVLTTVAMLISFLINNNGVLKILMIIIKVIQTISIGLCVVAYFVLQSISFVELSVAAFAIAELIALILYIIDRDHRKTAIQVFVFMIMTLGSCVAYSVLLMLIVIAVLFVIIRFIWSIFQEPEHRTTIYDTSGNIIGFLKRD